MNMMMQIRNKTPHPAAITTAAYRTVLSPPEKEGKLKYDLMYVQIAIYAAFFRCRNQKMFDGE